MNDLNTELTAADLIASNVGLPALFAADPHTRNGCSSFLTANICNANTRQAYARAVASFAAWCKARGLRDLRALRPIHIATYIESLQAPADPNQKSLAAPSVKQHLAALRMLFDWLVVGQLVPSNPATSVRGPKPATAASSRWRKQMANHESARTTGLYDRRSDQVNLDEVERILI